MTHVLSVAKVRLHLFALVARVLVATLHAKFLIFSGTPDFQMQSQMLRSSTLADELEVWGPVPLINIASL